MMKNVLKACPVCSKPLIISKLHCADCNIEYAGNFETPLFAKLDNDELEFIVLFLKNEGNISKVQNESGKSYANIKNLLKEINVKLGSIKNSKEDIDMELLAKNEQNEVVKVIQNKLLECGGTAKMRMLKGNPLDIWFAPSGEGIENSGFPALVCEWRIFEAIVKKANELGGMMYRGDSAAQSGAKIGSAELPVDTIDAFISLEFYGKNVGDSILRRSTYYAAVLAWAGIVENHRSEGKGGYIVVKPEFRK